MGCASARRNRFGSRDAKICWYDPRSQQMGWAATISRGASQDANPLQVTIQPVVLFDALGCLGTCWQTGRPGAAIPHLRTSRFLQLATYTVGDRVVLRAARGTFRLSPCWPFNRHVGLQPCYEVRRVSGWAVTKLSRDHCEVAGRQPLDGGDARRGGPTGKALESDGGALGPERLQPQFEDEPPQCRGIRCGPWRPPTADADRAMSATH